MTTTTINAERAVQIANILDAFGQLYIAIDSIVYDDIAETVAVLTVDVTRYVFEIGSDDDALVFVNVADPTDVISVDF